MSGFFGAMLGVIISAIAFYFGWWIGECQIKREAKREAAEPQIGEVWRMERRFAGSPWTTDYLYVLIDDKKEGWVRYFYSMGYSETDFVKGKDMGGAEKIDQFMRIFERKPL